MDVLPRQWVAVLSWTTYNASGSGMEAELWTWRHCTPLSCGDFQQQWGLMCLSWKQTFILSAILDTLWVCGSENYSFKKTPNMVWEVETRWATTRAGNELFVHRYWGFPDSSFNHGSWVYMSSVHQLKRLPSGWMTTAATLMVVISFIWCAEAEERGKLGQFLPRIPIFIRDHGPLFFLSAKNVAMR